MRTTVTLEDGIYEEIKRVSQSRNIPVKTAINLVLSAGLRCLERDHEGPPFSQETFSLGRPYSEYDLIKALEVAGGLEVAEVKKKLELRK